MFASREGRNQKKILGSRFRGLPLNFLLFFYTSPGYSNSHVFIWGGVESVTPLGPPKDSRASRVSLIIFVTIQTRCTQTADWAIVIFRFPCSRHRNVM